MGIFLRMIPENVFSAFSANGNMLQVIFFAIMFGYFITKTKGSEQKLLLDFFNAAFQVMMKLATFALALVPYGEYVFSNHSRSPAAEARTRAPPGA